MGPENAGGRAPSHVADDTEAIFRDILRFHAERLPEIRGRAPSRLTGAAFSREVEETVRALQVFFNKWTVEITYILMTRGTLRFNELKAQLKGISGRTLSTRLKELESQGLVSRHLFDEMPVRVEYALTDAGKTVAHLTLPVVTYLRLHGVGAQPPSDAERWNP